MKFSWSGSNIETVLKVLSAVIVLMYVIGLIISNLHFMELGIADFPALNTQNAMTGVLFTIWLLMLAVLVLPLAAWLAVIQVVVLTPMSAGSRVRRILVALVVLLMVEILAAMIVGSIAGYLIPWGQPWRSSYSAEAFSASLEADIYVTLGKQIMDVFGHTKVLVATVSLTVFLSMYCLKFAARWQSAPATVVKPHGLGSSFVFGLQKGALYGSPFFILLLLSGFAVDVFPNLRANVGGRQPQIAELSLREVGANEARLFSIAIPDTKGADQQSAISVGEVAIWHQSDKFIYVMPLKQPSSLIALDIGLVKTIRHVRKYARIQGGSRIVYVGEPPIA